MSFLVGSLPLVRILPMILKTVRTESLNADTLKIQFCV